ncbi:MAG: hypothetical protein LBU07_02110 [Coriobacteriales bacterium]|nr:hypothetical protein [Coriobacteriales bacterium]
MLSLRRAAKCLIVTLVLLLVPLAPAQADSGGGSAAADDQTLTLCVGLCALAGFTLLLAALLYRPPKNHKRHRR